MLRIGRTVSPRSLGVCRSTRNIDRPVGLLLHLFERRGARQQQHQVGVLHARDPHLLAVDDVAVAAAHRHRPRLRGVGAGGGLGDGERLQPQAPGGQLRQVLALLRLAAVPHQRAHDVHLRVAGAGVGARSVDLLEDHRRFGQRQAAATVGLGNQRRQPAGLGQRRDERLGVGRALVHALPVVAAEPRAQLAHGDTVVLVLGEPRVDVGAALHMPRNVSHGTMMARYTAKNTTPSTAPSTQKSRRGMKPLP